MLEILNTNGAEEAENITAVVNLCSLIGMKFAATGNMSLLLNVISGIIVSLKTNEIPTMQIISRI